MDQVVKYKDTSKQVIEIWKGGTENPEASVAYDSEAQRHMRIQLKEVTKEYDTKGDETVTTRVTPLEPCPEQFYETDYDKLFYKTFKNSNLICAHEDEL